MDSNLYINHIMSFLLKKIIVPSDFHSQTESVKEMQRDDLSGLVDTLTDFAVETATVDFHIESENENLTKILKEWLFSLNKNYKGQIPMGIKALAKEYFKERWKYSSFAVLKIAKWENVGGIILPTQMYFADGGSIYSKDKNNSEENLQLINYDYYLGHELKPSNKLSGRAILDKTNGRWFDEYPTPYLIKRGVYHNWKIVESLKNKETEILEQVIPYMMLVKKGTEKLATENIKIYSDEELKAVKEQFQKVLDEQKIPNSASKTNFRATNFDEMIEHIIPDLLKIFDSKLFQQAERNILAGLGFIDVVQGISDTRRESVLNPKVFIEEVKTGVEDFKQILTQLIFLIIEKNKTHIKYVNSNFHISSSPIKGFMTDKFKERIRQLYDRGLLSIQTAVELIGEIEFKTEVYRREQEAKKGLEETMYPHITENKEDKGIDLPGDADDEDIPDDKKDSVEKKNFNNSKIELITAPYSTTKDLPTRVKNNMDVDLQRTFVTVFNNAFKQYKNDTRAFRVAWSVIRQIARKDKNGKWTKKRKRVNGKLQKIKLTQAMLERILDKEEKEAIEDALKLQELKNATAKSELLNKLLKSKGKK